MILPYLLSVLMIVSCTHQNLKPVVSGQDSLVQAYVSAKSLVASDPAKACAEFQRLSNEQKFSLKGLAYVRQYLHCPSLENFGPMNPIVLNENPWLAPLWAEAWHRSALAAKNWRGQIESLLEMSKFETNGRKKTDFVLEAKSLIENIPVGLDLPQEEISNLREQIQQRLYLVAPRMIPKPRDTEFMKIANDYQNQREFRKAREFYNRARLSKALTADERYLAARAIRQTFKIEQDKEAFVKACRRFANSLKSEKNLIRVMEANLTLARAIWTAGDMNSAKKILLQTRNALKGKISLEEVYWVLGRMQEEAEDFPAAIKWYQMGLDDIHKNLSKESSYRSRVLFSLAWAQRKSNDLPSAITNLTELLETSQEPSEKAKALYWKSVSQRDLGKSAEADAGFQQLAQEDPIGYYGILSYKQRSIPLPAFVPPVSRPPLQRPIDVSESTHELILALAGSQEDVLLKSVLEGLWQPNTIIGPEKEIYLLRMMAEAGLYLPLFAKLNQLPNDRRFEIFQQFPELVFPQKFKPLIETWSRRFELDPELPLSIIRQESAFNPLARSSVDALGVMQVMPSAAQSQATRTGIQFNHHEDLFVPEINIPMGVSLLSQSHQRFQRQMILTVASYNANEKAIHQWLKSRFKGNALEFIEDIPYEETRNYVKLVFRNYVFYQRINHPGTQMAFPDFWFAGLDRIR